MQGDFTRFTFDPTKHYAGVLMQQGRVQLDADWNEQQAIDEYHDEAVGMDTVGPCGAPHYAPGFAITVANDGTLTLGKGHFYVSGILCESEADFTYDQQPDYPSPPTLQSLLSSANTNTAIIYLDVWQRHITPIDDPYIREKALGGPDTTSRVKTVWQVKILPVQAPQFDASAFQVSLNRLVSSLDNYSQTIATIHAPEATTASTLAAGLRRRLTAPLSGAVTFRAVARQLDIARASLNHVATRVDFPPTLPLRDLEAAARELAKANQAMVANTPFPEWYNLINPPGGRLTARLDTSGGAPGPCYIPPSSGFNGAENQLYRVEIHHGGSLGGVTPTFKWSRDNGSVVTALEKISGTQLTVHDLGRDQVLGFAPGQWVEILDDRLELGNLPGQLAQIASIDSGQQIITLAQAATPLAGTADGLDPTLHPKIRRWDQTGGTATADGVSLTTGSLPLENNISVQFSASAYQTGQYWTIPARINGQIEWPPFEGPNVNPFALPPQGITHHYCQLGILRQDPQTKAFSILDSRRDFAPLAAPAIRVIATNWQNDEYFLLSRLLSEGLQITLDAEPAAHVITSSALIVTLDIPVIVGATRSPVIGVVVDGQTIVISNVITWIPDANSLQHLLNMSFGQYGAYITLHDNLRMRVTLKGHAIWMYQGIRQLHLDGQAFGQPFVRADDTAGTALVFPTGSGARASDFESWLFLGMDTYEYQYGSQTVGGDLI